MNLIYKNIANWQEPVLTEKKAFELLKEEPLRDRGVTFLSVPWATLIDQMDHGTDAVKERAGKRLRELEQESLETAFTVCQHDRFHLILPTLKKMGVKTLFASHMVNGRGLTTRDYEFKGNDSYPFYIDGIRIETIFLWPVNVGENIKTKDVWYSYIGSYGNKHISPVRADIMEDKHPANCVCVSRGGWQFDIDVYQEQILGQNVSGFQRYVNRQKAEFYKNTLSRSRFALCPSGTGPAIIRFLEAVGSGAIPVVLSDNMMFPAIKGVKWEDCCIKIAEKDYNTLRDVLSNISREEENAMREKGLEAYRLSSGDNYVRNIRDYYEEN